MKSITLYRTPLIKPPQKRPRRAKRVFVGERRGFATDFKRADVHAALFRLVHVVKVRSVIGCIKARVCNDMVSK
jgi:hypothetical protein